MSKSQKPYLCREGGWFLLPCFAANSEIGIRTPGFLLGLPHIGAARSRIGWYSSCSSSSSGSSWRSSRRRRSRRSSRKQEQQQKERRGDFALDTRMRREKRREMKRETRKSRNGLSRLFFVNGGTAVRFSRSQVQTKRTAVVAAAASQRHTSTEY